MAHCLREAKHFPLSPMDGVCFRLVREIVDERAEFLNTVERASAALADESSQRRMHLHGLMIGTEGISGPGKLNFDLRLALSSVRLTQTYCSKQLRGQSGRSAVVGKILICIVVKMGCQWSSIQCFLTPIAACQPESKPSSRRSRGRKH